MCNLRLLIIHNVHIPNGLNRVSNNLRFLQWTGYTSECLPSSFQPKELVELNLIGSKIKYLWKGVKYLENLKCMDLRYSEDLIETPNFRGVPRLERLHLSWCNHLVDIHPSIGKLSRLIVLDLEYCVSLTHLPSMSSEMESLTILKLCSCSKIRKIPEFKGTMRSLSELHLDKTTIEKLPSSIEFLTALTLLSLRDCQYLTCIPRSMDSLRSLEKLVVIGCSKLTYLPEHLWNMKCLEHDLSRTAFKQPLDRNVSVRCRSLSPTQSRFPRGQWIQWTGYTSECLPSSFQPKELVELNLIRSKIKYLWKGVKEWRHSVYLSFLHSLIKFP
ncbi:hypothetical protein SO802_029875 [Lithocarpus litseifolius]|uniref:Uncharacterized protein n=1 Tax=Lithocarpus litseifolius TaxID=425828 RepID=A0AAW2BW84_9ROSI